MKRNSFFHALLLLLIGATLAFIWSRSLKSIPASRAESEAVGAFLKPFLELFVGKGNVTDHLVRKLAHFCEYGLLGVEVTAWFVLRDGRGRRTLFIAALGFFTGFIDETIQFFSGRGNQFSDVMLDLSGFVCGMFGLRLLLWLFGRREKHGE